MNFGKIKKKEKKEEKNRNIAVSKIETFGNVKQYSTPSSIKVEGNDDK